MVHNHGPQQPNSSQPTLSTQSSQSNLTTARTSTGTPAKKPQPSSRRDMRKKTKHASVTVSQVPTSPTNHPPTAWKRLCHFGWWWEVGGVFVGISCTCLTIAILLYMNGKALEAWKLPIQPNSLIAVFSTVGKSALLVPVAESLSQLKWTHFEDPRPRSLAQMQVFDDASRGPWGALVFLWRARVRSPPWLGSMGALITLLMLAFEPFAQQVVEFPTRQSPVQHLTGSVSYLTALPNSATNATLQARKSRAFYSLGIRGMLFDMASAVPTNANCPTQDCHLPDFTSLAACATCESEEFNFETASNCTFEKWDIHDGSEYQYPKTSAELLKALKGQTDNTLYGWSIDCIKSRPGYPTFSTILGWDNAQGPTMVGPMTDLNNFTNSYTIGKSWGATDDRVAASAGYNQTTTGVFSFCYIEHPDTHHNGVESIFPYTCFTLPNNLTEFEPRNVNNGHFEKPIVGTINWCRLSFCAQRYEQPSIRNNVFQTKNVRSFPLHSVSSEDGDYILASNDTSETFTVGKSARDQLFEISDLKDFMDLYNAEESWNDGDWATLFNATASVTSSLIQSRSNPVHKIIAGAAYAQETFVRVRWVWYILPLSAVAFSTLLLLLTAIQSASKPYLYKTSLLASLFHGMEGWSTNEMRVQREWGKETGWDLLKVAEGTRARFGRGQEGDLRILKAD